MPPERAALRGVLRPQAEALARGPGPQPRGPPMRATPVLRRVLGMTEVSVEGFAFAPEGFVLRVRPRRRRPRCSGCGRKARRVAEDPLPADRFERLKRIGVDEFCWSRPRGFLTIVWDHDRRRVLDPFHVLRLARDAVDEVRRRVVRELREAGDERARAVKNTRYLLLRHGGRLLREEQARLAWIEGSCKPLHRAWPLKEMLGYVLERRSLPLAKATLKELLGRMARSRLRPFVRLARTLREHQDAILASIRYRLTNAPKLLRLRRPEPTRHGLFNLCSPG